MCRAVLVWYNNTSPFTLFSLVLEYDEGQKEITIFIFFTSSRPQPIPIYLQDIDFSFDPFFWSKLGVLRYLFYWMMRISIPQIPRKLTLGNQPRLEIPICYKFIAP